MGITLLSVVVVLLLGIIIGIFIYISKKQIKTNSAQSKNFVLALRKNNNSIGDNECVARALEILKAAGFDDFEFHKKV